MTLWERLSALDRLQQGCIFKIIATCVIALAGIVGVGAYLLTRTQPQAWRSEDTILVVDAMFFALNDAGNRRELGFAFVAGLGPRAHHVAAQAVAEGRFNPFPPVYRDVLVMGICNETVS